MLSLATEVVGEFSWDPQPATIEEELLIRFVPEGAPELQQLFLYRLKQVGRVWYGPVTVARADAPAGKDVSAAVSGALPTLERGGFAVISYRDEDRPTVTPRARVQLVIPQ